MGIPSPSVGRRAFNYVWDSSIVAWIPEAQPAVSDSTQISVSSLSGVVRVAPSDTNWASSAGFHFTAGELQVVQSVLPAGSTTVSVAAFPSGLLSSGVPGAGSSGLIVRVASHPTDNPVYVTASGNSTVVMTRVAQTPLSPVGSTLSTASAQIVAANSGRTGLVITNLSTGLVFLGLSTTAQVNKGIALNPNGGVWVMDGYTFTTGAVNGVGVANGSSSPVAVQEFS